MARLPQCLIIFYRNPELGKVKTRLAATVGDEMALAVYYRLASHTREISKNLSVDKVVYYSHRLDTEDDWKDHKALQTGGSLGERMQNAFRESFSLGYQSVCIIGTDCWELSESHIKKAFEVLKRCDGVIGPALDGGYYLLGMNKLHHSIFENKEWSTSSVFSDTVKTMEQLKWTYELLEPLRDVDVKEDLPDGWWKGA